ncbi:MAG: acylphosphatase [Alphaproteobacteria bacterium]|nr:acylphosphatase [Alphaproteobacteria bacterium]
MTSVTVRIEGRVQGVWYRGWTVAEATARGLAGWVRNRRDGSVEALFHGSTASVEAMIAACHVGPPSAHVLRVVVSPAAPPQKGWGFHQLPTL